MKKFFKRGVAIQKGSGKAIDYKSGSKCSIDSELTRTMLVNQKGACHFYNVTMFSFCHSILLRVLGQDLQK